MGKFYKFIKYALFLLSILLSTSFLYLWLLHKEFGKQSVVLKLKGGVGNQLFQYAAAHVYAKETGRKLFILANRKKYDLYNTKARSVALENFNLAGHKIIYKDEINPLLRILRHKPFSLATELITKISNYKFYKEISLYETLKTESNINSEIIILDNFYESELFFANYTNEIQEIFKFRNIDKGKLSSQINKLNQPNSVCIHARLGDMEDFNPTPDDYFTKAIDRANISIKTPKFFIFSDQTNSLKQKFSYISNQEIISNPSLYSNIEELFMLSQCKNIIISRSTFGWWGAYLNRDNKNLIIAPSPKFGQEFYQKFYRKFSEQDLLTKELYKIFSYPHGWKTINIEN